MIINFEKYHGAGNDFILLNSFNSEINLNTQQIQFLCDRHLGIGADGLMILLPSKNNDFEMKYFNSDGKEGSMCGNGGRCILAFAFVNGIINKSARFGAIDGTHFGEILQSNNEDFQIVVSLNEVNTVEIADDTYFLNTGSPHHVQFIDDFADDFVLNEGTRIRWSAKYSSIGGTNVNFVKEQQNGIFVRTFERGVENETLSCGTGVTASAIANAIKNNQSGEINTKVGTLGGELDVKFDYENSTAKNIKLFGPVKLVFKGIINI